MQNNLSKAKTIIIFREVDSKIDPGPDYWYIIADNMLLGFEVTTIGVSDLAVIRYELNFGSRANFPTSAAAFRGEVILVCFS